MKTVLRFEVEDLVPQSRTVSQGAKVIMAHTYARAVVGEGLCVGKLQVGQVIDYNLDARDGRVNIGLVIEWRSDKMTVGSLVEGD